MLIVRIKPYRFVGGFRSSQHEREGTVERWKSSERDVGNTDPEVRLASRMVMQISHERVQMLIS